tara:strand:+ start:1148 stop:1717 length:570 start_codon:yes stop_codon:yes gene_type:complete
MIKKTITFYIRFITKKKLYFLIFLHLITCSFSVSSCGYKIEGSNPNLPNEAQTIAILPIQNQTFIAGLETDLSEQLNKNLRSNSALRVVPSEVADLKLNITLLSIKSNTSQLTKEEISSGVRGTIKGKIILIDNRIRKNLWENLILMVNLSESQENEMESTSGVSISRRTRQLIKLFSTKIYDELFYNF